MGAILFGRIVVVQVICFLLLLECELEVKNMTLDLVVLCKKSHESSGFTSTYRN